MKVIIETRDVYGNRLVYPVCDKAKTFARLTNKKTFSREDLLNIQSLGFELCLKAR